MVAQVTVDAELCQSCAKCLDACPVDVFRLGEDGKAFPAFVSDCHVCHQCEDDCPCGAILVSHAITSSRKVSIYDQPGLTLLEPDWSRA